MPQRIEFCVGAAQNTIALQIVLHIFLSFPLFIVDQMEQ